MEIREDNEIQLDFKKYTHGLNLLAQLEAKNFRHYEIELEQNQIKGYVLSSIVPSLIFNSPVYVGLNIKLTS